MSRVAASVLALALVARVPLLYAQEAPPPTPTFPEGVTALEGERPMRFVMTGGNSFVATRIGEDPDYFWIRRDGELARVRKNEIASMSYQLEERPRQRTAPTRPPSLLPLEEDDEGGVRASPPGKGLIVGGAVLFGIFYGGTLLFAPGADGPGELLLIPVFGPIVYGLAREARAEDIAGLAVVSALQGAGALMIYLGLRASARGRENRRGWTPGSRPTLAFVPELSARRVGLDVTGAF